MSKSERFEMNKDDAYMDNLAILKNDITKYCRVRSLYLCENITIEILYKFIEHIKMNCK